VTELQTSHPLKCTPPLAGLPIPPKGNGAKRNRGGVGELANRGRGSPVNRFPSVERKPPVSNYFPPIGRTVIVAG
jgi:hypothetical protein